MNVADLPEPYTTPSREEESFGFAAPASTASTLQGDEEDAFGFARSAPASTASTLQGDEGDAFGFARSASARAASTAASTAPAGAASTSRQCRYELANGHTCRRWAVRAHDFCQQHGRWMSTRVDGALEIPLLEDPASITHVLSQTARALSWGRIPPSNARAIIAACRALQIGFGHAIAEGRLRLAEAKFRLKLHQLKLTEQDLSSRAELEKRSESNAVEGPAFDQPNPGAPSFSPAPGERVGEANAPSPEPCALETVDCAPSTVDSGLSSVLPTACDPCIAAIQKGADASRLDCDHCPAYIAGNLRARQLPDPHNPPEDAGAGAPCKPAVGLSGSAVGLSGEQKPQFLHLRQKWDDDLWRAAKQQTTSRDHRLSTPEDRAHPFDEYLHTPPTAPPPPVPGSVAPPL
ncbi:MAG: hypothetical protein WBD46_05270 [Acidobacteriaceae bacterium]